MIIAPLPSNETDRLQALYSYKILDTEAEDEYDQLTQAASLICQAPIALISLIDKKRQWFKSKQGVKAPEFSRDLSVCSHAILNAPEPTVIEDGTKDPRFFDNPLVCAKHLLQNRPLWLDSPAYRE